MKLLSTIILTLALLTTACGRVREANHSADEEYLTSQEVRGRYGDTLPEGRYQYLGTELTDEGELGRAYGSLEDSADSDARSLRTKIIGPLRRIICGAKRCVWVYR